jgi:hypothetical protein
MILPVEIIECIVNKCSLKLIVGDRHMDRFLITTCSSLNQIKLFNALVSTNNMASLICLLYKHRSNLLEVFDIGVVTSAIEYCIKHRFFDMGTMLLHKFRVYAKDRWTIIIRTSIMTLCKTTTTSCEHFVQHVKYLNRVMLLVDSKDKNAFSLTTYQIMKLLQYKHSHKLLKVLLLIKTFQR